MKPSNFKRCVWLCVALAGCQSAPPAMMVAGDAPGPILQLHDAAGVCVRPARRAVYVADGQRVEGCWVLRGALVAVVFLDGDVATVPAETFRPAAPEAENRLPIAPTVMRALTI